MNFEEALRNPKPPNSAAAQQELTQLAINNLPQIIRATIGRRNFIQPKLRW